ncbi:MAG TPA: hypothetical protein DCL38_08325, partial [Lachnospiraceae bacterium]|nr:hypothetical protein [Lachnospiraceae bacterium]
MKRKIAALIVGLAMTASLAGCAAPAGTAQIETVAPQESAEASQAEDAGASEETASAEASEETAEGGDYHIGIVTGSVSQSEDDRRGAEAFQEMYGEDRVKLAIYPDNFTEELETTIQTIVNLSDDPDMKAIIVNQAIPGTTEAFRQIKER